MKRFLALLATGAASLTMLCALGFSSRALSQTRGITASSLMLRDTSSGYLMTIKPPILSAPITIMFPDNAGTLLSIDALGNAVFGKDGLAGTLKISDGGSPAHYALIQASPMESDQTFTLPATGGTFALLSDVSGLFLPLAGGTMTGTIDMGGNNIANLGTLGFGTASPAGQLANTVNNPVMQSVGINASSLNWQSNAVGWAAVINNNDNTGSGDNGLGITVNNTDPGSYALYVQSGGVLFDVTANGNVAIDPDRIATTSIGNSQSGTNVNITSGTQWSITNSGAASFASTGSFGGALNMNSNQINNVANPTSAQDAATKNYVDVTALGTVILAPATSARNTILPTADVVPLTLKGVSGQTSDLLDLKDNSGNKLLTFNSGLSGLTIGNSTTQGILRLDDASGTTYTIAPSGGAIEVNNNLRTLGSVLVRKDNAGGVSGDANQVLIEGSTITNEQLELGYNTSGDYGTITAIHQGVSGKALYLNPVGGSIGVDYTGGSALPATLSVNGSIASIGAVTASGFNGPLTGNVVGNVSGNLTGNVTGNLTGNVTGNVSGTAANVTGIVGLANGGTAVDNTSIAQNAVFAGPTSGTGSASFRALVASDLPDISGNFIQNQDTVTQTAANFDIAGNGTIAGVLSADTIHPVTATDNITIDGGLPFTAGLGGASVQIKNYNVAIKDGNLGVALGSFGVGGGNFSVTHDGTTSITEEAEGADALTIANGNGGNDITGDNWSVDGTGDVSLGGFLHLAPGGADVGGSNIQATGGGLRIQLTGNNGDGTLEMGNGDGIFLDGPVTLQDTAVTDISANNWTISHAGVGEFNGGITLSAAVTGVADQIQFNNGAQGSLVSASLTGQHIWTLPDSTGTLATTTYVNNAVSAGLTGTGTANTMTKFTAANTVGNSALTDNSTTLSYSGTHINSGTDYEIGGTTVLSAHGTNNIFAGAGAGNASVTGVENTAVGSAALHAVSNGQHNTAFGANAEISVTSGNNNIAVGDNAIRSGNGSDNVAVGDFAMGSQGGTGNIAIGSNTLFQAWNLTNYNTVMGTNAMPNGGGNGNNVAIGVLALAGQDVALSSSQGIENTGVGANSGLTNQTGSNNTFVGFSADASANNLTNATAIGNGAKVGSSNSMQLGDANVTLVNTSGVVQTTRGFTLSGSAAPISLTGSTPVTGNSGDVLTSAGAGATPTWTSTSGFTANAVSLAPASSTRNVILPTGDFTALTLQAGSATPSADIFDIQSHSASDLVAVGATGNVGIGQAPGTHQLDVTGTASIAITPVISDAALRILNSGSGATSQDGEIITTNGAATIAETGLEIIQTDNGGGTGSHTGIKFTVQNGASNTDILGTSSNWKVTSAGAATFGGGATVTGATNVNSTGSATTTIGNYNSTTPASSTVTNLAGTNVYSYAPSGGASAYTVPQGATVVEIADDGTATGVAVTLPAGTNGQVLYIHNADAQAETSIGIPIGATWTMIYSGGAWHHAN